MCIREGCRLVGSKPCGETSMRKGRHIVIATHYHKVRQAKFGKITHEKTKNDCMISANKSLEQIENLLKYRPIVHI